MEPFCNDERTKEETIHLILTRLIGQIRKNIVAPEPNSLPTPDLKAQFLMTLCGSSILIPSQYLFNILSGSHPGTGESQGVVTLTFTGSGILLAGV